MADLTRETGGFVADTNIEKFIGRMEAKMEALEASVAGMKEEISAILQTVSDIKSDAKINHNEQNSRHANRDKNCSAHTLDIENIKSRQRTDHVRIQKLEDLAQTDRVKEGAVEQHEKKEQDKLLFKITIILAVIQVVGFFAQFLMKKYG